MSKEEARIDASENVPEGEGASKSVTKGAGAKLKGAVSSAADGKAALLGVQHLLAMYAGSIAVPLVISSALDLTSEQTTYLISIDIFMCGLATLLQLFVNRFTGIGLPIVLGCAFQYVSPIIVIAKGHDLPTVYGSILVAGVFVLLIASFFAKIRPLFPPIVTGIVITVIGLTLIPVAVTNLGGGDSSRSEFGSPSNLVIGFSTIGFILLIQFFARGFARSIAVLLGLFAGTVLASLLGMVSLDAVQNASWFHLPVPFYFGAPKFDLASIVLICLIAIIAMVESTGVYFAISSIVGKEIDEKMLGRGYRAEGLAIVLGGLFNTFPYTGYSQNVGLLQLSGIRTRKPIFFAGAFLIVLGLLPKFGACAEIIPTPVLGGAMIVMFGMVVAQGIRMLSKIDFMQGHNLLVVAVSLSVGIGFNSMPELFNALPDSLQAIFGNGIVSASISAILLNLIFNELPKKLKRGF